MTSRDVLVIALTLLAYALVSRRLTSWWITMPMVFVTAGGLFDAFGVADLTVAIEEVGVLAEITLAIILFSDAARMDVGRLRRNAGLPARLLLVGLPVTIALGTFVSWWVLPGISVAAAALIASVLAPTDAALGEAIVSDPDVPVRIRDALNVEAGLNDGLAVPAVILFVDLTSGGLDGDGWIRLILRQIVGGTTTGVVVGAGAAWLILLARRRGWVEPLVAQIATLATALAAYTLAGVLDVNGFIAAFVAGLAFGAVLSDDATHLGEYTTDTGVLLSAVAFFVFGNLFVADAVGSLSWRIALCAVLTLTVGRVVPVAVATFGLGMRRPTVLFLGWFGPRGLASIVFGILLLEEDLDVGPALFDVIALVVVLSVFAHGITATPGAARYGRWYAGMGERTGMPESVEVDERRTRRHRRAAPGPPSAG